VIGSTPYTHHVDIGRERLANKESCLEVQQLLQEQSLTPSQQRNVK